MNKPKVIFCDIDGTLLLNGEQELHPELFREIKRLQAAGVRFCPASGRQINSLRSLFAPVAEELDYMCENGNIIYTAGSAGNVLHKCSIPRSPAEALCGELLADPRCEVMISGAAVSYLLPKDPGFPQLVETTLGNRIQTVAAPEDIPEDILKIAAYITGEPNPIRQAAEYYIPRYEDKLRVAVAGERWLDFTPGDKGDGVRCYCRELGIDLQDAMAFGDNWNDRAMLETVGMPVLMENADPALLEQFPVHCGDVTAVLRTIE